ncbi:hypothetical protein BM1_10617 [Bipolaris maydis]|nr:hypothetical protein BM1_10617 [Bipolaris maydis]
MSTIETIAKLKMSTEKWTGGLVRDLKLGGDDRPWRGAITLRLHRKRFHTRCFQTVRAAGPTSKQRLALVIRQC